METDMAAIDYARASHGHDGRFGSATSRFFAALAAWNDARVTRNALAKLSDRELEDIGLARGEIANVAAGHFSR